MIKTLLIIILAVVLAAGAFLSRPNQADFKTFIEQKTKTSGGSLVEKVWGQLNTDSYIKSCTFNDRLLWVDVQKDGKTIYTGAFNHWFARGDASKP